MSRKATPEPIVFDGWWGEEDKADCPEPWERFTVMVYGEEAGDYREATVDDLALAGFVPVATVEDTLRNMMRQCWLVPNIHTDEEGVIELLRQRLRQQMER